MSQDHKSRFIEFALEREVLRFGEFTLKSGRQSPYFFNTGRFNTGKALARLGQHYAQALVDSGLPFDMVFGPAYKGIPLAASLSIALAEHHGRDIPYAFDRKEPKTHGEGNNLVGAPLEGRVLIIDDVISSGMSVRGAVELIREHGAEPAGVAIALDRQERGEGEQSAVQEVTSRLGLPVVNIICLDDLVGWLETHGQADEHLQRIRAYRDEYGVSG
ncbi:orotate phosphoribosyltransferase [Alkalispirillum mobile]|uniref:Orotate phosphoribosyltransferase n=1 Tax=Alkalispirillum mobile TaxID=85925 RepID=A0A498C5I1_9GAMM|nr:orotate phosphoribosyltransferase [Alkalispirillum mobile]RLK51494.1 orotate phosphoribosyltransferase [Alkalispirillum mobile]